ncbi:ATP-binding protein [Pseudomonas nitroreducens]|uniref:ATP-binding protein n=1 Tax=Pseudomonas nitroreducens TaxID=46680 RepID=UPI00209DB447|nr:ATP-binding protein [Pseudomonas nitroreducens]MCP1624352.1 two-component system sensor histidine kinase EvgS/two-component system response regulator EvgA [Pseudomonas nitroreducens]
MSRILIVDEQPVTRHALRLMMEADRHEVVGEADNGPDALQQVRLCKPDLMILELSIPRLGGLEVLQRLVAQESPVKVLVLTSQDSEYFAGRCLTAGAAGFVSKQENPQSVREAVRAIAQGHSYFPSHALGSVSAAEEAGHGELLKGLSVRELSVLQLLARGLSNIAIAEQLSISDKTVSTYKVRLMQKLHAKSLVELIDIGRRHGLVEGGVREEEPQGAPFEEEERLELDLMRSMLDALPHPISVRGLDGRIRYCNKAAHTIPGKTREEMIGSTLADLGIFASQSEGRMLAQQLTDIIASGEPLDIDLEFHSNAARHVVHFWSRPYRNSQGVLVGAITGAVDITQRDELIRVLRNTNARVESVSRGKSQFLASMGSELQGPLQSIAAMLDLALNQGDPDLRREPLGVARSLANNLLHVLDDLQMLSRADAGRLPLVAEEVDLRVMLERKLEKLSEPARAKGIAVEADFELALQTRVWCDPQPLRIVLDNLLGNALKFTDRGSIRLRLLARGHAQGLVGVQIEVTDTGVGIAPELQEGLFDPFAQPLDSQQVRRGGSGLGLALSRSLVEAMGGELLIDSRPGVGTSFLVRLELAAAQG